jgi:hypothetical protein
VRISTTGKLYFKVVQAIGTVLIMSNELLSELSLQDDDYGEVVDADNDIIRMIPTAFNELYEDVDFREAVAC